MVFFNAHCWGGGGVQQPSFGYDHWNKSIGARAIDGTYAYRYWNSGEIIYGRSDSIKSNVYSKFEELAIP